MSRLFTAASSQYLTLPQSVLGTSAYPISFACWFKPTTIATAMVVGIVQNAAASQYMICIFRGDLSKQISMQTNDGTTFNNIDSTTALAAGVWYHVVCAWIVGISRIIYINGVNVGSNSSNVNFPTMTVTNLGSLTTSGTPSNFTNGTIADAAWWRAGLTQPEAMQLYKGSIRPDQLRPAQLAPYWPLEELTGSALDAGPGRLHLSQVNNPTYGTVPPQIRWTKPKLRDVMWNLVPVVAPSSFDGGTGSTIFRVRSRQAY